MQKYWLRAFKILKTKSNHGDIVLTRNNPPLFVFELANCGSVCVFNVDIVEQSKRIHPLQEIEKKKAPRQEKLFAESIE